MRHQRCYAELRLRSAAALLVFLAAAAGAWIVAADLRRSNRSGWLCFAVLRVLIRLRFHIGEEYGRVAVQRQPLIKRQLNQFGFAFRKPAGLLFNLAQQTADPGL